MTQDRRNGYRIVHVESGEVVGITTATDEHAAWTIARQLERERCEAEQARYLELRERLEGLAELLGVPLVLGYTGNVELRRDDRSWDVCIGAAADRVPRSSTEGRGPWSHRADGLSYPATRSWRTWEAPTADELEQLVRERLERERAAQRLEEERRPRVWPGGSAGD